MHGEERFLCSSLKIYWTGAEWPVIAPSNRVSLRFNVERLAVRPTRIQHIAHCGLSLYEPHALLCVASPLPSCEALGSSALPALETWQRLAFAPTHNNAQAHSIRLLCKHNLLSTWTACPSVDCAGIGAFRRRCCSCCSCAGNLRRSRGWARKDFLFLMNLTC